MNTFLPKKTLVNSFSCQDFTFEIKDDTIIVTFNMSDFTKEHYDLLFRRITLFLKSITTKHYFIYDVSKVKVMHTNLRLDFGKQVQKILEDYEHVIHLYIIILDSPLTKILLYGINLIIKSPVKQYVKKSRSEALHFLKLLKLTPTYY